MTGVQTCALPISIVLGEADSKVRNAETISLLDYGFNNVKLKKIVEKGTVVEKVEVSKATKEIINVKLKNNLNVIENAGINNKKYKFNVKVNKINLPVKKNDIVGKIEATYNGKVVSTGDLIIDENIEKLSYFELLKRNMSNVVFGNL